MDRKKVPSPHAAASAAPAPEPNPEQADAFQFAGMRLEADGSLFRGKTPIHLPPRELDALRLLLKNAGRIITPTQFRQALWGDVHVTADSVPRCLSSLRARLDTQDCIQTVYKRGYRLVADVRPYRARPLSALPRLAIAPFTTHLGVPDHLGSILAEEAIARLSNVRDPLASILARDSVFSLAGRGLAAQQIGEALHADLVLAGAVRALPSHFRLRLEMIRVADGIQIWVEDMLVAKDKVAGIEDELLARLHFRLSDRSTAWDKAAPREETEPFARRPLPNGQTTHTHSAREASPGSLRLSAAADTDAQGPSSSGSREAYELYRQGHHESQSLERHRMQDALGHLTRAIELDPSLTAAKIDLAHLCVTQSYYGFMSPAASARLLRQTVESIPDFPDGAEAALPALGWFHFYFDRDFSAALDAFERSSHLPHDGATTRLRGAFALSRRRFAEASSLLRAAIALDPYAPRLLPRLAWTLHLEGRTAESVAAMEEALRLFPDHAATSLYGAMILAFNGQTGRAVQLAEAQAVRQPWLDAATAVHAYTVARAGQAAQARGLLERLQWLARERFVLRSFNPAVYVALGDTDAALAELRAADQSRCPWFFQLLADPRLTPLHGHPEFEAIRAILPRMEAEALRAPGHEVRLRGEDGPFASDSVSRSFPA